MKINCKQTITKLLSLNHIFLGLFVAVIFFFISSSVSFAPTKPANKIMTDSDLSNVIGQAFFNLIQSSNLNGSANVIHIDLGVDVEVLGWMTSSKTAYWNNGPSTGWDLDTLGQYYGGTDHVTSPLILNGLYLEFGFDNIGDNATRTLNYIDIGSNHATGKVSGTIGTITALFSGGGTGQNSGVLLRQTAVGYQVTHFYNEPLGFLFAAKYRYDTYGYNSNLKGIFQRMPNHNSNLST
jgi:hypothetical protein